MIQGDTSFQANSEHFSLSERRFVGFLSQNVFWHLCSKMQQNTVQAHESSLEQNLSVDMLSRGFFPCDIVNMLMITLLDKNEGFFKIWW